jgi:hypothetical protein
MITEKTPQSELDLIAELSDFRQRVMRGEEVTDEELKESIQKLQTFRDKTAKPIKEKAEKKAASTVKKSMTKQKANDMLADLLGD